MNIVPAILENDFDDILKKYNLVSGLCGLVQLDVADGLFVDSRSSTDIRRISELEGPAEIDLHLMVNDINPFLQDRLPNVKSIGVHIESPGFSEEVLGQLWFMGYGVGVSIRPETDVSRLQEVLHRIDYVQFLAVDPGKQGNPFQDSVIGKVKELKDFGSDVSVWVDGGLNDKTLPKLLNLGIDNAVIGSAIFNTRDPAQKLKDFQTAYGSK